MRKILESIEITAPLQLVWEALRDFGDVAAWAPYMRFSHLVGEQETGVGTRRAMQHEFGFRFEEEVTAWLEHEGYDFDVFRAPWPLKNVKESWRMETAGPGLVRVTTRVEYETRLAPVGTLLDAALVRFVVRREMRSGVRGLKAYVERQDQGGG
jgi:hypothetical protein